MMYIQKIYDMTLALAVVYKYRRIIFLPFAAKCLSAIVSQSLFRNSEGIPPGN